MLCLVYPSEHATLFWRCNNVADAQTTSLQRQNDIVCLLGSTRTKYATMSLIVINREGIQRDNDKYLKISSHQKPLPNTQTFYNVYRYIGIKELCRKIRKILDSHNPA